MGRLDWGLICYIQYISVYICYKYLVEGSLL